MLGTIVNTACIIVGTLAGTLFKRGLGEQYSGPLHPEPGHRRDRRDGPRPGRPDQAAAGPPGRRQFRQGADLGLPALLHRHLLDRRAGAERHPGRQHVSFYELHAGPGDVHRLRHDLRLRHDPRRPDPLLLAGVHLADRQTGFVQSAAAGDAGQRNGHRRRRPHHRLRFFPAGHQGLQDPQFHSGAAGSRPLVPRQSPFLLNQWPDFR